MGRRRRKVWGWRPGRAAIEWKGRRTSKRKGGIARGNKTPKGRPGGQERSGPSQEATLHPVIFLWRRPRAREVKKRLQRTGLWMAITAASYQVIRADLPEPVVYELTRLLYKYEREIRDLMAMLKDFGIQNTIKCKNIPAHLDAKRIFPGGWYRKID